MVNYTLVYAKQAQKDAKKISRSNLKQNATDLLNILKGDPFRKPPEYEALVGDLQGAYSRRINIQQRIVYQVLKEEKVVKVIRMWTHYGESSANQSG
jgi:toxin YoeB